MSKVSVELDSTQLEKALTQLGTTAQLRLAKRLAARQLDEVVAKLRRTVRQKGLSPSTMNKIVEQARQEVHDRRRH